MPKQTFMTRADAELGQGLYDSIAWIFEVHVKTPDTGEYNSAVLHGNEDCPETIQLWRDSSPNFGALPDAVYVFDKETREYSLLGVKNPA